MTKKIVLCCAMFFSLFVFSCDSLWDVGTDTVTVSFDVSEFIPEQSVLTNTNNIESNSNNSILAAEEEDPVPDTTPVATYSAVISLHNAKTNTLIEEQTVSVSNDLTISATFTDIQPTSTYATIIIEEDNTIFFSAQSEPVNLIAGAENILETKPNAVFVSLNESGLDHPRGYLSNESVTTFDEAIEVLGNFGESFEGKTVFVKDPMPLTTAETVFNCPGLTVRAHNGDAIFSIDEQHSKLSATDVSFIGEVYQNGDSSSLDFSGSFGKNTNINFSIYDPNLVDNDIVIGKATSETVLHKDNFSINGGELGENLDILDGNLVFVKSKYTVTFDSKGGTPEYPSQLIMHGETAIEPDPEPSKVGYDFEYWEQNGDLFEFSTLIVHPIMLTAHYTPIVYKINYINDGGEFANDEPTTYTIETPTITLPKLVKEQNIFRGWYLESDFKTSITEITLGSIGDITLYAKWEEEIPPEEPTFTVTFNANGGTGTPVTQTVDSGTTVKLNSQAFEKAEHTFVGWTTVEGGTEVTHGIGVDYLVENHVTFYAVWEAITPTSYTVSFNANGGAGDPMADLDILVGESEFLTINTTYTKENHVFLGWNTEADGSGTFYKDEYLYEPTADITLYAQWGTEIYVSNDGTGDRTGRDTSNTIAFTSFLGNQTFDRLVVTETLEYNQDTQPTEWFGTVGMPLIITRSVDFTGSMLHLQQGSIDLEYITFDGEERVGTDPLIKVGYDFNGLSLATLTIGNGTIIENNTNNGIVFEGTNGYLDVKGNCKVRNNTSGNVVYNNDSGTRVQVAGELIDAIIGLSPSNDGVDAVIVGKDSFYAEILDTDKDCFILDTPLASGLSLTINEAKTEIVVIDTSTPTLNEVYISNAGGGDGTSSASPISAFVFFGTTPTEQTTVWVMDTIDVESSDIWDGKNCVTLKRAPEFKDAFVTISSSAKLTLKNIVFDGSKNGSYNSNASLIAVNSGELLIQTGTELKNNVVAKQNSHGGAVTVNNSGTLTMEDGLISNNSVSINANGGAVNISGGTFNMKNGTISDNSAVKDGGGVYLSGGTAKFNFEGGLIKFNTATQSGGGVYASKDPTLTISGDPTILENTDANGNSNLYFAINDVTPKLTVGILNGSQDSIGLSPSKSLGTIANLTDGVTNIDALIHDKGVPMAIEGDKIKIYSPESDFGSTNGSIQSYTGTATEIHIPPTITGTQITRIEENAFRTSDATIGESITKVVLPLGITEIAANAFDTCSSLTKITIPDSVTTIGDGAFQACTSLSIVYTNKTKPAAGDTSWIGTYNNPLRDATWYPIP